MELKQINILEVLASNENKFNGRLYWYITLIQQYTGIAEQEASCFVS